MCVLIGWGFGGNPIHTNSVQTFIYLRSMQIPIKMRPHATFGLLLCMGGMERNIWDLKFLSHSSLKP
jgi:hypothetical protein